MNMNDKASPRVIAKNIRVSSIGKRTAITYFAPKHPNDKKRIGQALVISIGTAQMVLNGTQINALRKVLTEARKQEYLAKQTR